jgi:hypothetical protein
VGISGTDVHVINVSGATTTYSTDANWLEFDYQGNGFPSVTVTYGDEHAVFAASNGVIIPSGVTLTFTADGTTAIAGVLSVKNGKTVLTLDTNTLAVGTHGIAYATYSASGTPNPAYTGELTCVVEAVTPDEPEPEVVVNEVSVTKTVASVGVSGSAVTVHYIDGSTESYDKATNHVTFDYSKGSDFAYTETEDGKAVFTAVNGMIIPAGTDLSFIATLTADPLMAYDLTGTVKLANGKTVVELDVSALPEGAYEIGFASAAGNPEFEGVLAKGYEKTGPVETPVDPIAVSNPANVHTVTVSDPVVNVTWKDGTSYAYNMNDGTVTFAYPAGMFSADPEEAGVYTAEGMIIPTGTLLGVTAKTGSTTIDLPYTLANVNGRTVLTADTSALEPGTYELAYASHNGANPYFSGVLDGAFVVEEEPETPDTPGSSGGGGCAAGAGLAFLGLAIPFLTRKKRNR